MPISILILLVAVGGAMLFFSANNETRPVLVATRDLPAGATLTSSDLAISHARLDDNVYRAALPEQALSQTVGKQLAEPVHAQQILVRAQLSTRPAVGPNEVAMTIPVTPSDALAGRLRPQDSVAVVATYDKGKPDTKTAVVLPKAQVYDIAYDQRPTVVNTSGSSGNSAPAGQISSVTLILTPDQAVQLSAARWNADLDLILLPPSGTSPLASAAAAPSPASPVIAAQSANPSPSAPASPSASASPAVSASPPSSSPPSAASSSTAPASPATGASSGH